jgi:predicted HicB family RNase H-like nuclease
MVMKEGTKTLSLRIPGELKFEIEKEAVKQNRSVNNLITYIIKQYLEAEKKRVYRK